MKLRTKVQSRDIKLNKNNIIESKTVNNTFNITQKKDEILFGQKSFLEIILGLIKNAQIDYLSSIKSNENNKSKNISQIKVILNELNQSLIEIKKEKEKNINLFQKQKQQRESDLKKLIFSTVLTKRSVSNSNYVNINYETLITENNENDFNKETPQLKLLNFKVENEIIKVENLSRRKLFLIQYYKTPHLIHEHRTEIICEDKKNNESMEQLLHQRLIQQREKFIETANMKYLQEMRINSIKSQIMGYINATREIQKSYRYVNTQEVITEENKSYLETVNEDENNENNFKNSKDDINNESAINKSNINNLKNLKLIDMNEVEKLLKLNMNINVNINYNQQYINNHFDNKKKSDTEDDNSSNLSKKENMNDSNEDKNELDNNEFSKSSDNNKVKES